MVLVAEAQQLKAKLMLNDRPEKMVRKKMLDGAGMIAKVPQRRKNAADIVYCEAIDKVTKVLDNQLRSQKTSKKAADEHKMYVRLFDEWLVREGFGSYFEAELEHGRCIEFLQQQTV